MEIIIKGQHKSQKLAIIGAGASGLGVLRKLDMKRGDQLDVYDTRTHSSGFPYDKNDMLPYHVSNMDIKDMSYHDDEHYKNWIARNEDRCNKLLNRQFEKHISFEAERKFGRDHEKRHHYREWKSAQLENFRNFKKRVFNTETIDDEFYAPRIVYGLYMKDNFNEQVLRLRKKGVKVNIKHQEVTSLSENKSSGKPYRLTRTLSPAQRIMNKSEKSYDKVVLCTGHWQKNIKEGRFSLWPSVNMKKKVLSNLYNDAEKSYKEIGKTEVNLYIGVLGTSLSSIDGLKILFSSMLKYNEEGELSVENKPFFYKAEDGTELKINLKVYLISRNGYLPKVRSNRVSGNNQHLTEENVLSIIREKGQISLKDIWKMLSKDLDRVYAENGKEKPFKNIKDLSKTESDAGFYGLKEELKTANEHGSHWQEVYSQAAEPFRSAYPFLPAEDKIILSKIKSLHQAFYAPIPRKNAEELVKMHEAGLVDIKSLRHGSLIDSEEIPKKEAFGYNDENDGDAVVYSSVIDATGQDPDAMTDPRPLFQSLKENGLVSSEVEERQNNETKEDGDIYDLYKSDIARSRDKNGDVKFNTGQLRRTDSFRLLKADGVPTEGLYAVGVTASRFGITRAKAMFQEGEVVGLRLTEMRVGLVSTII